MKKLLNFIFLAWGIGLASACATDPGELNGAMRICDRNHPPLATSIDSHYLCVQERVPFGAYRERGIKEKSESRLLHPTKDSTLAEQVRFLSRLPEEDYPWLAMELGSRAMAEGDPALAHALFEDSAEAVSTIYGSDVKARKAREYFRQEAEKLFIGETHERAMVFHYLGILDLMRGDYQNARASFRASLLQDSLSANKQYKQDFGSSLWLRGWAARCAGNASAAREDFSRASEIASLDPPGDGDNLVVVWESGIAPYKIAAGDYGERLAYQTSTSGTLDNSSVLGLQLQNNMFFQANTRGERGFDQYLAEQSESKETAANVAKGTALAGVRALEMAAYLSAHDSDAAGIAGAVGLGLFAVSAASAAVSASIQSIADVRSWRSLPDNIYIGSFAVPATTRRVDDLARVGAGDTALTRLIRAMETKNLPYLFSSRGACHILWIREI